jgi:hypothetical protein
MFPNPKKLEPKIPDAPKISDLENTLKERKENYGDFCDIATTSQNLKYVISNSSTFLKLSASKRESLSMILHKIARIVHGNPNYIDNWHDIAGYATLIENEIKEYTTTRH